MRWARSALRGLGWRELAGTVRWPDGGSVADGRRQAGSGRARKPCQGATELVSQGQRWGRCKVRRRAERVSRPAREKKRRRRVLVVTSCSPRPMRAVQRASNCVGCQERWAISAGHEPRHVELFLTMAFRMVSSLRMPSDQGYFLRLAGRQQPLVEVADDGIETGRGQRPPCREHPEPGSVRPRRRVGLARCRCPG